MQSFEQLGSFYLGKVYDLTAGGRREELLLYDSKDLVTHAVCVGMTGSGKTGLCLGLLEEAAIDGVPAIIIDPKGDLGNLLLTFPALRGEDFEPWIDASEAQAKGLSPSQLAERQAQLWRAGLAEWGQDGARIEKLKSAADFAIYTPGSTAGRPVSILRSFAPPDKALLADAELLNERIGTTVGSLLGLLGIPADPLRSREYILLAQIFNAAWSAGQALDLAAIIQQIQAPPFKRVGALELEAFYPAGERFELALRLNNLLATPGFSCWMEGEPLDIGHLLYGPDGRPRMSIFSIAHLSDSERMFFVALLLNEVLGWVRRQSGTTSLRALLYMDEIAGFFPPVANPPSKAPFLTLMKQGRAFGLGVVLATQNPVDLDYKGLANAGTWFIGRLQTEQDKARVLDGLESASAQAASVLDRAAAERAISALPKRVFLMKNVHETEPVVFETRWCMSYLRGPLTRNDIQMLMSARRATASTETTPEVAPAAPAPTFTPAPSAAAVSARAQSAPPVLGPEIRQYFLAVRRPAPAGAQVCHLPMVLGLANVYFRDAKLGVDVEQAVSRLVPIGSGPVPVEWNACPEARLAESDLEPAPLPGAFFEDLPAAGASAKSYEQWKKDLAEALYRTCQLELLHSAAFKMVSKPNEDEREFRARLGLRAREQRDALAEKLRQKYAPKIATLQERIRRAQQAVEVQQAQAKQAKLQTALSFGAAVLSSFLGRKAVSAGSVGKATTAVRGVGRSMQEAEDVARAAETVEALQKKLAELQSQFEADVAAAGAKVDQAHEVLETITVKPRKTDVAVRAVLLAWAPHFVDESGRRVPAWV
jgi:hypothetical protein